MERIIKRISAQEVLASQEMLEDSMFDLGLSGQVPVSFAGALLFCLGKRVGIQEERRRRRRQ